MVEEDVTGVEQTYSVNDELMVAVHSGVLLVC